MGSGNSIWASLTWIRLYGLAKMACVPIRRQMT